MPVVADVINTPDLSSFSAYGVENCYAFHGYALADVAQVSLVGGVTGQAMSYTSRQYGSWSIVYWILPVKLAGDHHLRTGGPLRAERGPGCSGQGVDRRQLRCTTWPARSIRPTGSGRALINNRTFLVAFAKQLIDKESARASRDASGTKGIST